ncbi:hypothetical protein RRG08_002825 [Elysia crispata]|uniref:Uncharacterized protein n=1 Tax=Elysia crispata TaxID=231223 RepID=A0AAE1CMF5_9GAST|nr:hypothetical protein RRG08_002825 [Elysia crispata]
MRRIQLYHVMAETWMRTNFHVSHGNSSEALSDDHLTLLNMQNHSYVTWFASTASEGGPHSLAPRPSPSQSPGNPAGQHERHTHGEHCSCYSHGEMKASSAWWAWDPNLYIIDLDQSTQVLL